MLAVLKKGDLHQSFDFHDFYDFLRLYFKIIFQRTRKFQSFFFMLAAQKKGEPHESFDFYDFYDFIWKLFSWGLGNFSHSFLCSPFIRRGNPNSRLIFTTLFEKCISEDLEFLVTHLTRSPFRRRGTPPNVRFLRLLWLCLKSIFLRNWKF